ncbi:thioredoxin family protein [Microbacterium sp. X-17]|uniref:TlpA family protein disulfide reductase n=1 Tax=Microbacterium sp. X-17 TaxID=3144404 RepID=UPI0031F49765
MTLVGALIAVAVLLAGAVIGGVLFQRSQGRAHHTAERAPVDPVRLGDVEFGRSATLVQFSTEMCAKCPGVRRTLTAVADAHDGVRHVDVDLTHRPDIARDFGILQTPTTLILDGRGVIRTRLGGALRRDVVETELVRLTEAA